MKHSITGQIHLFDYLKNFPDESWGGCGNCICQHLYNCEKFVKDKGAKLEECIMSNITVYQDGYKYCGFGEAADCERCYEYLMKKMEKLESQEITSNRSNHD